MKKRFFGIGTWFITVGWEDKESLPFSCWWDATTQPQRMVQMNSGSDCSSDVSTVDLAARAAIFEVAGELTTVSLDTGEILSQQRMPEHSVHGSNYFAQQQAASVAPELVV